MNSANKIKRLQVPGVRGELPDSQTKLKRRSKSVEVEGEDNFSIMDHVGQIIKDLNSLCSQKDQRFSKPVIKTLNGLFNEMKGYVYRLVLENENLKGKLSTVGEELNDRTLAIDTYASKLKSKIEVREEIGKANNVVLVRGSNNESSDTIKQKFLASIDPHKDLVRIDGIRKMKEGGIVVTLASDGDKVRVLEHKEISNAKLQVQSPVKWRPRMLLVDVPRVLEDDDLLKVILALNLDLLYGSKDVDLEYLKQDFRLLYRVGKRRELLVNWVVEVFSPELQKRILNISKIYVDYRSCPIRDFYEITRCYKCQMYGHIARNCRQLKEVCYKCGKEGHRGRDCEGDVQIKLCIPCKKLGRPHSHNSGYKDCYAYQVMISRYKRFIDYG
ncbi:uncharacterized protein LOC111639207 [Centruroides sculpturatus]|uniref:uncharacterized protein LOC111639207 n=1 Tax=Centruroides sculpturatus TaxID=218467 RepID=UPI000C6E4722|nr:uncharacterized protein LOC111639207 [Centruroides sculpturatus]